MISHEEIYRRQLIREREVIRAMQYRGRRWMGPVLDIIWRKPWRSPSIPAVWNWNIPIEVNLANWAEWLRNAHDCSDPSIGCSCQGGFRFPNEGL